MTPEIIPNGLPTVYEGAMGLDHFANPPQRRHGALGLLLSEEGLSEGAVEVLMCEKNPVREMRKPWYHPGGAAEENEDIDAAVVRMTWAKLGIEVKPGEVLVEHQMFAEEHVNAEGVRYVSREGMNWVYDLGAIPRDTAFTYGAGVIGHRWFKVDELSEHLSPFTAERTLAALEARKTGKTVRLKGHPK